ncbi:ABC transporter permease [Amycolatopsis sp. NPDC058340]|uniref:Fructose transport system permease protein n=2 Tax=Amycolatopsis TaxID=1813 RepID=R4TE44_9PSEU|nr:MULTISPECIES: ABC transporter permease [Amycolatopsis]AGM10456.1 fructose transport system permease protein [Amycolatopsis keratiniphila]MBE1580588.1 fructose transport system permease protein [Amycolatopsis roodepoortensis]RSN36649.1 ABC transporter permease [Amycolatopsis sp. WAC 04169]
MTTATLKGNERPSIGEFFLRAPAVGPALALLVAIVVFSLSTDTFLDLDNLSLVVQQSLVIGTLALGQTLIILTAGIDLANAAAMVLATLIMAKLVVGGVSGIWALLLGIVATVVIGMVTGSLVTRIKLPPFIVTLGLLTVLTAAAKLFASGQAVPVADELLKWLGTRRYLFGGIPITYGMTLALLMYLGLWYALTRTPWGKHVYAVGNAPESARLSGIKVNRTILSVYIVAGVIVGIAAWQALGRVPNADPNAFQLGNLDSITAVVLGGASLFGGRGSVLGTMMGALVVAVLRSGLTQLGVDALYQDVATGALLIGAVCVDRFARRQQS